MSDTKDNNASGEIIKTTNAFNQLKFIDCQKSADTNDPDGLFWLGYCYEYGIGVEKDENKAFIHYQKSAEMNNPNGMCQVGYFYSLGIGVEIDKHKAFIHYLNSAFFGNPMGIFKTAICYFFFFGVGKSYNKWG
ncbi:calmodulin-dependent protein kinase [Gigaspora margarita]|uniref:Calmodulin-dependent protein kinase n=1 Tax=Gigaspora margarita TaxID=4874 RepID=A0A8H3X9G8_GIGMA|nr:calmodulin-dependent protein kinase [Gigaspora margarita]